MSKALEKRRKFLEGLLKSCDDSNLYLMATLGDAAAEQYSHVMKGSPQHLLRGLWHLIKALDGKLDAPTKDGSRLVQEMLKIYLADPPVEEENE